MLKNKLYIYLIIGSMFAMWSCKSEEALGPDPYAGGKEALGIRFAEGLPTPSQGRAGSAMTFKVYGIANYKDKLSFLINNQVATISNITDTTITAILPENVSTGGTTLIVNDQAFAGPVCQVMGKLSIDPTFNAGVGTNGVINVIKRLNNGQVFLGGSFTDYNGFAASTDINGIVRISANGEYVKMNFGEAAKEGSISSIHEMSNGNLLLSGKIEKFNENLLMNNIVEINSAGGIVLKEVEVLNLTSDPTKSTLEVPVFNGGTNFSIAKTFVNDNKVTALGFFGQYVDRYYVRSTYDNVLKGNFVTGGVVRMHRDGSLDSTFNINKSVSPAVSYKGFEGIVNSGMMQDNGQLLVVGNFQRYNNTSVSGNIIGINIDGTIASSFLFGTGADGAILGIEKSLASNKYLLTGNFNSFNGFASASVVLLNEDGSVDASFKSLGFTGGTPSYAKQLSNGLILVSGSFNKYNGIIREGLCILNPDGTLAKDYNNTGKLDGYVRDIIEGVNSLGQRTVTLVGWISRFNGKSNIGNIMRLTLQD